MHVDCRRLIERKGECRRWARKSQLVQWGGVAGLSMVWQTNRQQGKPGPLAKAIVKYDLPSTYFRGLKTNE